MSNYYDIERAVVKAVTDAQPGVPTGFPGNELQHEQQDSDTLWLQVHNLRAGSEPVTLGDKGEDDHRGVLQIDINAPKGKGSAEALQKADELAGLFTAGKSLLYNAQEVRVIRATVSPGVYVGNFYRLVLSVFYYARTVRNP